MWHFGIFGVDLPGSRQKVERVGFRVPAVGAQDKEPFAFQEDLTLLTLVGFSARSRGLYRQNPEITLNCAW